MYLSVNSVLVFFLELHVLIEFVGSFTISIKCGLICKMRMIVSVIFSYISKQQLWVNNQRTFTPYDISSFKLPRTLVPALVTITYIEKKCGMDLEFCFRDDFQPDLTHLSDSHQIISVVTMH